MPELKLTKPRTSRDLQLYFIKFTQHLLDIASGNLNTRRRTEFFKSWTARVNLQKEIRPGPLTLAEYYTLMDIFIHQWLPENKIGLRQVGVHGGIPQESDVFTHKEATNVIHRQFALNVLLPELIIKIISEYGPELDGKGQMSLEEANEWMLAGGSSKKAEETDWVEYVMGKRELYK